MMHVTPKVLPEWALLVAHASHLQQSAGVTFSQSQLLHMGIAQLSFLEGKRSSKVPVIGSMSHVMSLESQ